MSNGIFDLLKGQLSQGMVEQLASQIGGADTAKTSKAATGAIEALMGALARNSTTIEGRSALANALERDHDGSVLNDFMGMATGATKPANAKMMNGAGILKHVLGGKQGGVVEMISQMSGLQGDQSGNLLSMLAPLVMGALGNAKKTNNLDAGGLGSLLQSEVSNMNAQSSEMGLFEKLLDSDNDGSIVDDVAGFGMKMLGGLFKK